MVEDEEDLEEQPFVVVSCGSLWCLAGEGGDDAPVAQDLSVIGRPIGEESHLNIMVGNAALYMGLRFGGPEYDRSEVQTRAHLSWPVRGGEVVDWHDAALLWKTACENCAPGPLTVQGLVLVEPPMCSIEHRRQMVETAFEAFPSMNRLALAHSAGLVLLASGKTTGLVLECGETVCYAVPMKELQILEEGVMRLELGGRELTKRLSELLAARHGWDGTQHRRHLPYMRHCKERHCFVALHPENVVPTEERTYEEVCINEPTFVLGEERWRCPEALFDPSLVSVEGLGVHQLVYKSICKCPASLRQELYLDIVCSGGSTLFAGFADRLQREVSMLAPGDAKVMIKTPPERRFSPWIGASILGSLSSGSAVSCPWITRADYLEKGLAVVNVPEGNCWLPAPPPLPELVATIHFERTALGGCSVRCCGLGGAELVDAVDASLDITVKELRLMLSNQLPEKRLSLVLPSARLLTRDDDDLCIADLLTSEAE